jgi:hypothetical protein
MGFQFFFLSVREDIFMDNQFPPNTKLGLQQPEAAPPEEKKVEPVVKGEVSRRKKPLGKRFHETFFGGDMRGSANFVVFNVLIPAAKEMLVEAGAKGVERLVYGESSRRSSSSSPNPYGSFAYNKVPPSTRPPAPNMSRRAARARHDFDEIVLQSRGEAEEVLERMYDLLGRYETVSVADLYELTGISSVHTDQKWGWVDLRGSTVQRTRQGGYVVDLPEPQPLG